MKPKHIILFGISIFCLCAGTAVAQQGERRGPPGAPGGGEGGAGGRIADFIKKADANADGKISKEEFVTASTKEAEERFSKIDANTDGFADMAEITQLGQRMREGGAGRPGGEGQSPGQGMRRPGGEGGEGGFRRPPGAEGGPPPGGPPGGPGGERPQGGPPGGPGATGGERPQGGPGGPGGGMRGGQGSIVGINPDELFSKMDKNTDGSIDLAEFSEPQKAEIEGRFKKMDENSDGKVTKEEMKSGAEKMRSMMMQRGGQGGPGGMRGPGGQGGPGGPGGPGGGEGGFRRPPAGEGGATGRPRPETEGDAPKKEGGV